MNEENSYNYLYWDLPRSHTVYRITAIALLLLLLFTPSGNSLWFVEGQVLELNQSVRGFLIDDHGHMLLQIIDGETDAKKLAGEIRERFGEDAVITETEKKDQYKIQLGAYQ